MSQIFSLLFFSGFPLCEYCWRGLSIGGNPSILSIFFFPFCCLGFVFLFCFCPLFGVFVIPFVSVYFYCALLWVFWFSFRRCLGFLLWVLVILILLQMTETFKSILKGGVIYFSSCTTIRVRLCCERCLDIDSFWIRSKATNR